MGRQQSLLIDAVWKLLLLVVLVVLPSIRADSIINSDQLLEWEPISTTIVPGEVQHYQFPLNSSTASAGQHYQMLVFITANICSLPTGTSDARAVQLYYSFSEELFDSVEQFADNELTFDQGYLQGLAEASENATDLYLVVTADNDASANGSFSYELGVSQNDLVFQWDDRPWVELVDADDSSALFVTGNLSISDSETFTELESQDTNYRLHIFSNDVQYYFEGLARSWCAITKDAEATIPAANISYSFTSRGASYKQQMYVDGLDPATEYIAYLSQDYEGSKYGGAIFERLHFSTQEQGVCTLLYNLSFCSEVAYSVPRGDNKEVNLGNLYDDYAREVYSNFSKELDQISCDAEDDARYSPIVTCDDCATSYKDWLCSVTIPRCSTRNHTGYLNRSPGASRNDFINKIVNPPLDYFEVLPCIDMCHNIVKNCPSDFNFACPKDNTTIQKSYYFTDDDSNFTTCNFVGSSLTSTANAKLHINQMLLTLTVIFYSLYYIF